MERRFAFLKTEAKTIYIDPTLYNIPVSVTAHRLFKTHPAP